MEKLVRQLPSVLFSVFAGKLMVVQEITAPSCLVLLILGAVSVYLDHKKSHDKIDAYKEKLAEIDKKFEEQKNEMSAVKNNLVGMRISQQVKPFTNRG